MTSLRDTEPATRVRAPTPKRHGAEDREGVNFAFGIVQVHGASLGISLSLDAPSRVTCWSCWEDVQPRADPGAAAEVHGCLLPGKERCRFSADVRTSCAIEFLYEAGEHEKGKSLLIFLPPYVGLQEEKSVVDPVERSISGQFLGFQAS